MTECPSRLVLAQHHTENLDSATEKEISAHVRECDRCAGLLREMAQNAADYNQNIDQHAQSLRMALASQVEHNAGVIPLHWRRRVVTFAPFAAAAVLILSVITFWQPNADTLPNANTQSDIVFKGDFTFMAVARRGTRQFKVSNDSLLHEDDAVRFMVQNGHSGYLYIFSIDNRGAITSLYPFNDTGRNLPALSLTAPGEHTLDGSIVLDNARGREYFVAVFSKSPFETGIINARLAKALIANNKENGESQPSAATGLPDAIHDAVVRVIAINKK